MSDLIYRYLKLGDQVSWEHPVTGKVYDFEVTDTDWNDEWQPLELQLLDDVDYANIINVSEYSEFSSKGFRRWPYISNRAHKDRYGWGIPENSITLDRLFYTADRAVKETQDGRILADRESIEDFAVVQGDAAYPASVVVPEKAPEASQIESASLTGSKLEIRLSSGENISTIVPKLVLPKPEALRKVRDQGEEALLDSCIQKIVEQNSEGKTSLKMEYAELLTLKSKLEESGYLVDLADCEISW